MTKDRIATLILLTLAIVSQVRSCGLRSDLEAADAAANELRTEALASAAVAAGWEVELVDATTGLEQLLQEERDRGGILEDEKAELARQAETLNGRIGVLADLYADARGQISELDATVFVSDASSTAPDSVVARVDDGLLTGRMAFFPPSRLDLEYRLELAIALAFVDAPDGRAMVTAKSTNPSVGLRYGEVFYQPAPPVQYCSIWTRAQWGLGGFGVRAIMSLLGG